MNERIPHENHDDALPDALRAQLRGLRREVEPRRDLWAGIAASIDSDDAARAAQSPVARSTAAMPAVAMPPAAHGTHRNGARHAQRRPRRRLLAVGSVAASLALAVAVGWGLRPGAVDAPSAPATVATAPAPAASPTAAATGGSSMPMLLRQADAMSREYAGAMREVAAHQTMPLSLESRATLDELDRSAADIRDALAQSPDSRFLLERLQRVYERRLLLAQRLA